MASKLTYMKGDEFVKKILGGERDFRNIKLEEGFNLTGHPNFGSLCLYLEKEAGMKPILELPGYITRSSTLPMHLKESPIDVSNSELRYLVARGLYLPWTKGINTDLSYSNLSGVYLDKYHMHVCCTDLSSSDFKNANFHNVNLERTRLDGVSFSGANLENAEVGSSVFDETIFDDANLRNIIFNFEKLYRTSLKRANVRGAEFVGTIFNEADICGIKNLKKSVGLDEAVFYMTHATQKEVGIIRRASTRFVLHK